MSRPHTLLCAEGAVRQARMELSIARVNLWRARKWNYRPDQLRHFEALVCVMLDQVWATQQHHAKALPISGNP